MNDYLMHYGVKGMKWGVRKDRSGIVNRLRNYSGSRSSNALKEYRKKDINTMSNKELQEGITRMNLERQYRSLTSLDIGFGKRYLDTINGYDKSYRQVARSSAVKLGKQMLLKKM